MEKDVIKLLITEYQHRVSEIVLTQRPMHLEKVLNYVFVGLRRAGKSYLMYQQIHQLLAQGHKIDEILYFNFEDDRLVQLSVTDLNLIKTCYEEMFDTQPIFFLDEVQNVPYWEKFARRLADQGYRVYITGSNANMLSSEIATTLGGRYTIQEVFPYSFSEYLNAVGIDKNDSNYIYRYRKEILKHFETYFRYGGLPEILLVSDKRSWLSGLFQKIFLGDIVMRYQVRNDFALRVLVRKLAESVRQPSSFTRLANIVSETGKKISVDTVIDYISYMKESWLLFSLENYAAKLAEKESNKKYYFIDNGLLNLFLIDPLTSLLENQVAIELYRKYGDKLYYYHHKTEVDFYVSEEKIAVQACYSLKNIETRQREVNALENMSKQIEINDFLIVTKDEEETIKTEKITINVVPIWKWVLKIN